MSSVGHLPNFTHSRGKSTTNTSYRPDNINISSCPALIHPRRMIELAFVEARRLRRDGRPTSDALAAVDWIAGRTDWTRLSVARRLELWSSPAPPIEIRRQFVGTFDWCCKWLGEDPDKVRQQGLPATGGYNYERSEGGLPKVFEVWKSRMGNRKTGVGVSRFVNSFAARGAQ